MTDPIRKAMVTQNSPTFFSTTNAISTENKITKSVIEIYWVLKKVSAPSEISVAILSIVARFSSVSALTMDPSSSSMTLPWES